MSSKEYANGDEQLNRLLKILNEIGFETKEEAEAKAIGFLGDIDKISQGVLTRLHVGEEEGLSVALSIAERYKMPFLSNRIQWLFKLRCSVGGEARKEFVQVVSEKKKITRGIVDRILGRGKPESKKGIDV